MGAKEKGARRKEETTKLHDLMDENLATIKRQLQIYREAKDTTGYWKQLPKAIERSF